MGPGAATTSTGVPLFSGQTGLGAQSLARTGQGLSGPLSLAVVSIFLGALLLLAPRRGQAPAQPAAPGRAGIRSPKPGDLMDALERQLRDADARLKARYRRSWISEGPESEN
ncbi:MAG TPA: hypothetical protein VM386_00020 [Acidimicrobiales bacterium]|nr:hypothetical protein [Acidimicrobiales bacterium]